MHSSIHAAGALMSDIQAALRHLQTGQLPQAEKICRDILQSQPDHSDALYFLGVIALQSGRYEDAIAAIEKALLVRSEEPYFHYNLALAYQKAGRLQEAITAYRNALSLKPDSVEALENLGTVLADEDMADEAIECFRQVLTLQPGRIETHNNLGVLYLRQGMPEEALASHRKSLFLRPNDANTHNHLGNALKEVGRLDEALTYFEGALKLQPDFAAACTNLGLTLYAQGKHDEAIACYRNALAIDPRYPNVYNSMGLALQEEDKLEEALAAHRKALELDPTFAAAQWNLSLLLLMLGDYESGFEFFESRFVGGPQRSFAPSRRLLQALAHIPRWQGEPLAGKSLLVWTEQGLGDNLMMLRYLHQLAEAGPKRLIVYGDPALLRLVETIQGVDTMISGRNPLPSEPFDYHVPTMSLPRLFGTRLDTIPNELPYLAVPATMKTAWAERLVDLPERRIGLLWAGNQSFSHDTQRSMQLKMLAPLLEIPGNAFISLQKGEPALQLMQHGFPIHDWMNECYDLLDTAALISNLDLVITVDTAVAHLAAALGREVWLMNRVKSDWRWQRERSDSPWYPGLRIFRQPAVGDWESVVERIHAELTAMSGATSRE